VGQERVWVSFDEGKVPKPFYDRRFEENLTLCDIIFFVNSATGQYNLIIICAKLFELAVFQVFLIGDARIKYKHHAVETL
jgi:hypothetical protein